ncbi:MAG: (2Fe-2S) ferredoxin domain-containing protein [Acidobacteria bacterium]|jgi:NADH:ubiquinone oxidoreductase subunit E|nr:(2Fe-2S) ferredoxin domain-containing protein [Acidobacteriota bacterium]
MSEAGQGRDNKKVYVLVCKGDTCSKQGNTEKLRVILKQHAREFKASSVKIAYVSCLGLCGDGPNIMVVKGGQTFGHCTEQSLGAVKSAIGKAIEESD